MQFLFVMCVAVLVWLNYKNAYEYWTEQRLSQIREWQKSFSNSNTAPPTLYEVLSERVVADRSTPPPATSANTVPERPVIDRLATPPAGKPANESPENAGTDRLAPPNLNRLPSSTTAQQALGTLFLQLTMDDLGVCLPLSPANQVRFNILT